MKFRSITSFAAVLTITVALLTGAGSVSAHEQRDLHDYTLVVGFLVRESRRKLFIEPLPG